MQLLRVHCVKNQVEFAPKKGIQRTAPKGAIRWIICVANRSLCREIQADIFESITASLTCDKHLLTATCHINTRSWLVHTLT